MGTNTDCKGKDGPTTFTVTAEYGSISTKNASYKDGFCTLCKSPWKGFIVTISSLNEIKRGNSAAVIEYPVGNKGRSDVYTVDTDLSLSNITGFNTFPPLHYHGV